LRAEFSPVTRTEEDDHILSSVVEDVKHDIRREQCKDEDESPHSGIFEIYSRKKKNDGKEVDGL